MDANGDGKLDKDSDRVIVGNYMPDFYYGFGVQFGWKGLDLSVNFQGVYGNEIYRTWDDPTYAQLNYLTNRMERWNGEGTSNWEPILNPSRSINLINSNYFVEDGSFFRIRNVQLGYTFESDFLQRIYLKSLRMFANIQNLKTWTRNTGYTPEIGGSALAFGIDGGTYPMPMVYTFGVNLTF